jgi:glycosyltransferase involved in cell wall biosynthesis
MMEKIFEDANILYLSTYPPRECGIATFAKDLTSAIDKRLPSSISTGVIALNNNGVNIYNYPKKVLRQISDTDMNDYIEIAKQVNSSRNIQLINIQHEFGIFGGEWGDYLLAFLEIVEKPVIITFHSVLPDPNEKLLKVVRSISERVKCIVVMTGKAVEILRDTYGIMTPIQVIPHGIPMTSFEDQTQEKINLGYNDNIILSSFGMMSSGKGYEYVIEALPKIVEKFPNLIYLIIGETHPNVRKHEGEEYRNFLNDKIKELGLEKHVKFYNKYVTLHEIIQYLKATDIYISSNKEPHQITSGTLSYAMGCGRAIISTPFLHAKDIINEKRGLLVDFENSESFKESILHLLKNPSLRKEMEKESYFYTRHMIWPNVAIHYCDLFKSYTNLKYGEIDMQPRVDTSHLIKLTDDFGVIQFAVQSTPDLDSGYTLDDNARAILVCVKHYERFREFKQLNMIRTYLDYIKYVQKEDGKLYNLVDRNKKIHGDWSEDAHGRAIWSLGYLISSPAIPEDFKRDAEEILLKSLKMHSKISSPRAVSFIISGLYFYNSLKNSVKVRAKIKELADFLLNLYTEHSNPSWKWFEPYLTYGNDKLSEALLYAYLSTGNREYLDTGLGSLDFLISEMFKEDLFVPIGQREWYVQGGERSYYDQQPVDAAYMLQTLILAYKITKDEKYRKKAIQTFQWFTGKNSLNQVIYNEVTGGCHDGLGENSINLNQGAESTISYLLARLSLMDLRIQ